MDRFEAGKAATTTCNGEDRSGSVSQRRSPIAWSGLLAMATAAAILVSGLNGLVQIVKVAIECGITHRG